MEADSVFCFDASSFIDILEQLKEELREDKLQTLRELVKKAGGTISFDGDFKFDSHNYKGDDEDRVYADTELLGLTFKDDGTLNVYNFWNIDYHESEDIIPNYELDRIIKYVRTECLHRSEEYKQIMELLSLEENLYFNFVENGCANVCNFPYNHNGRDCIFNVCDVSRKDDGDLVVYGTLMDGDDEVCDISLTEDEIEPSYLVDAIAGIKRCKRKTPEKRVALTEEQKSIVECLKEELKALSRTGASVMLDNDYGTLFVINTVGIELNCFGADSDHREFVDIEKLPEENVIGSGYVCYSSEGIYINS